MAQPRRRGDRHHPQPHGCVGEAAARLARLRDRRGGRERQVPARPGRARHQEGPGVAGEPAAAHRDHGLRRRPRGQQLLLLRSRQPPHRDDDQPVVHRPRRRPADRPGPLRDRGRLGLRLRRDLHRRRCVVHPGRDEPVDQHRPEQPERRLRHHRLLR